jgi:DNA replication protein DnaC
LSIEEHPTVDTRSLNQLIADCRARFVVGAPAGGDPPSGGPPPDSPPGGDPPERQGPPQNPTIPPAFRWATFDAPELGQRVQRERAIAEGRAAIASGSLLLRGPSGSGKTSLACALLRAWDGAHPRRLGVFMPAWKLGVSRAQYGLGQGEAPEVERAMTTRLLLLDDLGSERNIATNAVPDVIFARAMAGLPTWVTTWMTAAEVAQRYGDGIARRLHEAGQVTAIVCGEARA